MGSELINGIPLVAVVIGLVEFSKQMGLSGKALTAVSLLIGAVSGIAYQCSIAVPATYAGWFGAVIYGLALGLSASGLYDFVNSRIPKAQ